MRSDKILGLLCVLCVSVVNLPLFERGRLKREVRKTGGRDAQVLLAA